MEKSSLTKSNPPNHSSTTDSSMRHNHHQQQPPPQSDFIMDKETGQGHGLDPTGEIAQRIREEIQAEQLDNALHPHLHHNNEENPFAATAGGEPRFGLPTAGRIHHHHRHNFDAITGSPPAQGGGDQQIL
ncbi:hypothetical protein FRC17_004628 [Serendipita sp. 399]|nr:hypothetical protein FRC17_004628 [Serendipita sp. 399]